MIGDFYSHNYLKEKLSRSQYSPVNPEEHARIIQRPGQMHLQGLGEHAIKKLNIEGWYNCLGKVCNFYSVFSINN